jgi:hypothetical protein
VSRLHIADTGLFVAMGQPSNSRYQAVRRFARRNDITFVLTEGVYEELTVDDPDVEPPDRLITGIAGVLSGIAYVLQSHKL